MAMDVRDLATRITQALEDGDYKLIKDYLTDDFQFTSNQLPSALTADQWFTVAKAWKDAFPNLRYNFRITNVVGDNVNFTSQVTGTHTGYLDLSDIVPGLPAIKATNKHISLPSEPGEAHIKKGKVHMIRVMSTDKTGLMGICQQIGVEIPEALMMNMRR